MDPELFKILTSKNIFELKIGNTYELINYYNFYEDNSSIRSLYFDYLLYSNCLNVPVFNNFINFVNAVLKKEFPEYFNFTVTDIRNYTPMLTKQYTEPEEEIWLILIEKIYIVDTIVTINDKKLFMLKLPQSLVFYNTENLELNKKHVKKSIIQLFDNVENKKIDNLENIIINKKIGNKYKRIIKKLLNESKDFLNSTNNRIFVTYI